MSKENSLGTVALTFNQRMRTNQINGALGGVVLGIRTEDTEAFAHVTRDLTAPEKTQLVAALQALSDSPFERDLDKTEFSLSPFFGKTPAEADDWIQANVTDLASAKAALRKISRVLLYLVRRIDL